MYPENIGPGTRFFFFNSLYRSAEINPDNAAPVLTAAKQILFGGPNGLDEKIYQDSIMESIQNAIDFLENMANFEATNERRAFEQQLLPLINSNPEYSKFKNIFNENKIDYPLLLTFINIVNKDIDEVKTSLHDLNQTTTNFNKMTNSLIKENEYDFTKIEQNRNELITEARLAASDAELKITSDVAEIGASLIRDITAIQNSSEQRAKELIEQKVIDMLINNQKTIQLSSEAQTGLTAVLMSKIRKIAAATQTIKGTQNKLKSLLNQMNQSVDIEQKVIKSLINQAEQSLNQLDILETHGQQIQKLINRGTKTVRLQNGRIIGLDNAARNKINKFLENQGQRKINFELLIDQKKQESKNILKKEVNETYVNELKERLGMQDLSLEELINELNQILKQTSQSTRKESITLFTEEQSASNLINLMPRAKIKKVVLDGLYNGKNDASGFFLGNAYYETNIDPKLTDILTNELNSFQKRQSSLLKENNKKNTNTTFDIELQTKVVEQIDAAFIEDIEQSLGQQQLTVEQIKDIFIIDSSAKFAETFMADEGGFHGGSLGADVETQINNINYMLNLGGITPLDAKWLLTATLNAGAGMIGSPLRPALENYFSTAAAMLMFRTGGNTIKQWSEQIKNNVVKAPTKIHIYTFDTIYVPQSYILKLTAEGLKKCGDLLFEEASNTGSRAYIYNPVSVSNLIQNDWEKTAKDNYKSVQIKMSLLGGFLDILNQMEEIMNSIPS